MKYYELIIGIAILGCTSCNKDWIETKPDQSIVVPTTFEDFEAALANTAVFNENQPSLLEDGADDYYHTDASFSNKTEGLKNLYTWASSSNFYAEFPMKYEWDNVYLSVFYANRVLEGLDKISQQDRTEKWKTLRGAALFNRSYSFYNLVSLYAKAFNKASADKDLGIIMRLESDININQGRSTVAETYNKIISDLKEATTLLPNIPSVKTNPSKAAALALLARVYLFMGEYDNAKKAASECIGIMGVLKDYNTVPAAAASPFSPMYTDEVIYYTRMINNPLFPTVNGTGFVDSTVLKSYAEKDLRRRVFFRVVNGRTAFKGSYSSLFFVLFNGLAVDEVYLIRAECNARADKNEAALEDLNKLLSNRYETGSFTPITTSSAKESLAIILSERRKELLCRGLRWVDLKRLNAINEGPGTLTRIIGQATFQLPPGDNRYVYPIPNSEIAYSNTEQNPR